MAELIDQLFEIAKPLFPEADKASIDPLPNGKKGMRFSWKTNDDPLRPSKRFQPVLIVMHEDFHTSAFAQKPAAVIHKEFAAFVRNKRAQFNPRTTSHPGESPTEDVWVFPPDC